MIKISGLKKTLHGGGHKVEILKSIDLTIPTGQFIAITGHSGSGKTTLLSLIAGLDTPTDGTITIDGQGITKLDEDELALLRGKRFGFIFQNFHLIPTLTALENVVLSAELNGTPGATKKSEDLLGTVGLRDRQHHYPAQLSGGEQQRLSLARAFVNDPEIILADEPTGNLDSTTGQEIMALLASLNELQQLTIIMVTHDERIACQAHRIVRLDEGRVETVSQAA